MEDDDPRRLLFPYLTHVVWLLILIGVYYSGSQSGLSDLRQRSRYARHHIESRQAGDVITCPHGKEELIPESAPLHR